jgi:putative proteasome-type protease
MTCRSTRPGVPSNDLPRLFLVYAAGNFIESTVGMPLDLAVVRRGEARVTLHQNIDSGDECWSGIHDIWGKALSDALRALPDLAVPKAAG